MKTPVIWEKQDIMTLVCAYMRRNGFPEITPEMLEYKGALEIKIMIDQPLSLAAAEAGLAPPSPPPAAKAPVAPPASTGAAAAGEEAEPDMVAVLRASQNNAQTAKRFDQQGRGGGDRPLASNESYEYPKD